MRYLILASLIIMLVNISSGTIILMDKYVIDTNEYALFDPAIEVSKATTNNPHILFWEAMNYPKEEPKLRIDILEFDTEINESDFSNFVPEAKRYSVNKPYSGWILEKDNMIFYKVMINNKTILMIMTSDINSAGFLLENLKIYPREEGSKIISEGIASRLQ